MNKLFQYFAKLGLFKKKNLVMLCIMYSIVFIGLITTKDIPKIIFWLGILFPFLFLAAVISLFYVSTFFEFFKGRLSFLGFIFFCIFVYIIWTGIWAEIFTRINVFNNYTLLFLSLIIILGIDVFLVFKFLWNIQMEKYFLNNITRAVNVMLINFSIIGLFFYTVKDIPEIIGFLKLNNYGRNFVLLLYVHFFVYCAYSIKFNQILLFIMFKKWKK